MLPFALPGSFRRAERGLAMTVGRIEEEEFERTEAEAQALADAWAISPAAYLEARTRLIAQHEQRRAAADPRHADHPRWRKK